MSQALAARTSITAEGKAITIQVDMEPVMTAVSASLSRAYRDALTEAVERGEITKEQGEAVLRRGKELFLARGVEEVEDEPAQQGH